MTTIARPTCERCGHEVRGHLDHPDPYCECVCHTAWRVMVRDVDGFLLARQIQQRHAAAKAIARRLVKLRPPLESTAA